MIKVLVPDAHGPTIAISFAGDDPRTYKVVDGVTEVEENFLAEFMAAFPGAKPAPPESAKPARGEK